MPVLNQIILFCGLGLFGLATADRSTPMEWTDIIQILGGSALIVSAVS